MEGRVYISFHCDEKITGKFIADEKIWAFYSLTERNCRRQF